MPFGIDDALINLAMESAKGVVSENTKSEIAQEFCPESFENDDIQEREQASPVEVEFSPDKFDANTQVCDNNILDGDIETFPDISENSIEETSPFAESSIELCGEASSHITFGNLFDDRTVSFLKGCEKYGIELPTSVTHAGLDIERHSNGGLLSIDKSIITTCLAKALANNKISQEVYEEMRDKLMSC